MKKKLENFDILAERLLNEKKDRKLSILLQISYDCSGIHYLDYSCTAER